MKCGDRLAGVAIPGVVDGVGRDVAAAVGGVFPRWGDGDKKIFRTYAAAAAAAAVASAG